MNDTLKLNGSAAEDEFLDLGEIFRPIAKKYGRDMFALVMNAGMARQAAEILGSEASRSRNGKVLHAIRVLVQAFNELSNDYVKKMEWDEQDLADLDQAIMRAFAGQLSVPETPKIILPH